MTIGEGLGDTGAQTDDQAQLPPQAGAPGDSPAAPGHQRHRPGPVIKALMVLTLLGFIAPFIALLIAHQLGNGAGGGSFPVNIRNDSGLPLTLRTCPANCPASDPSVVLTAGATAQVPVSERGIVSRYYLISTTGSAVGCLPLRFTKAVPGLTVSVSQAVACPGQPLSFPSGG